MQRRTRVTRIFAAMTALLFSTIAVADEIVVFGATGTIGQSIVGEALKRGHDVVGVSRSPEKFEYGQENFTGKAGNPTDTASVREIAGGVDAIIVAVGGRSATVPEETAMNLTALALQEALGELGADGPQIVVIGGGFTMRGSKEKMLEAMPPHAPPGSAMRALFLGHWAAYETYQASELNWTFIAPPMKIMGFREGPDIRSGSYRTSTTEYVKDSDGNNEISMSDLAVAALDFAEKRNFQKVKVAVGY